MSKATGDIAASIKAFSDHFGNPEIPFTVQWGFLMVELALNRWDETNRVLSVIADGINEIVSTLKK